MGMGINTTGHNKLSLGINNLGTPGCDEVLSNLSIETKEKEESSIATVPMKGINTTWHNKLSLGINNLGTPGCDEVLSNLSIERKGNEQAMMVNNIFTKQFKVNSKHNV